LTIDRRQRMLVVMEPHRLAEERSIAYHEAVAARLRDRPALLEKARERVRGWCAREPVPYYARAWDEVLSGPLAGIAAFLVDRGERARELRQSTPFAGMVDPRQRWSIWRDVRGRMESRR
jgi:hypothetical protein